MTDVKDIDNEFNPLEFCKQEYDKMIMDFEYLHKNEDFIEQARIIEMISKEFKYCDFINLTLNEDLISDSILYM